MWYSTLKNWGHIAFTQGREGQVRMKKLPLDQIQAEMLRCIVEHRTVQELFDAVYAVLRLPMICFDPSFSLVAFAFERPFYYSHWEWIAQYGRASEDVILSYDYFTNQEQMVQSPDPLLFNTDNTYGYPQYCGAVRSGDQLSAYCGIMVEDAPQEEVYAAAKMLIKAVSVIIRGESQKDGLDYALIIDKTLSPQQCEYLAAHYAGRCVFAVLTCEAYQGSTLQFVKSQLLSRGHRIISCLVGQDMLYLFASGLDPQEDISALMRDLQMLAETYHLLIGVSDSFDRAADIPVHRQQALLALSTGVVREGNRGGRIFRFEEYYCELICQAAVEYFGPELGAAAEIRLLQQEDRKRGSAFLRTLEVWLESGRQNALAAERLHLHKATLANHLDKIGELLGKDPQDCFFELQLKLDMYRALGAGTPAREEVAAE